MRTIWEGLAPEKKGIWLFCAAILLFSTMDLVAKDLMTRHSSMQIVWARYASQFFWTIVVLSPRLLTLIRTKHLRLQLIRSACLFGGTVFFFSSVKFLDLAEATAIFNISPLIITILSVIILKEAVGIRRWLASPDMQFRPVFWEMTNPTQLRFSTPHSSAPSPHLSLFPSHGTRQRCRTP